MFPTKTNGWICIPASAALTSEDEVFEIEREMIDRFGAAPDEVVNLCELMALKTQLRQVGVARSMPAKAV